ncbi:hypothetical protein EDC38_2962 [Marinimicrobium koreense]|uniref:Uncharacterized protein n=1 Tax=Marinimicrobium koreense TaxID=306545 RepID=A0A3N1NU09_9GAMM|nr:hypothetical protein EDC38_2962 [Marinimicrobium koreense]
MSDFSRRILPVFNWLTLMVIKTIRGGLAHLSRVALLTLLFAAGVTASEPQSIVLAPGLTLLPPSALSLEPVRSNAPDGPLVLVGHIEGEPGYFLVADRVTGKQRVSVLWEKLDIEMRGRADARSIEVEDRGVFLTQSEAKVWYRTYRYRLGGVKLRPVYYLIRQDDQSYWLTLTTADGVDLEVVKPIVDVILKRVIISSETGRH